MWKLCAASPPAMRDLRLRLPSSRIGLEAPPLKGSSNQTAPVALERGQARGGSLDVLAEDLAGIDEQHAVLAQSFARGVEMVFSSFTCRGRTDPSRTWRRESRRGAGVLRPRNVSSRRVAEKLRRVGDLGKGLGVAEQAPDRFAAGFAQHVPERHLDAGPGVRGLQEIHAVVGEPSGDARCPSAQSIGLPSTEAETGRHPPCDIGVTKAAIEDSGEASHSPQPMRPPASIRTTSASWLPSASVVTSGIER